MTLGEESHLMFVAPDDRFSKEVINCFVNVMNHAMLTKYCTTIYYM